MPMIYNGQEEGNATQLAFFERDAIVWHEHKNGVLYQKLFALKKANSALWNAGWGALQDAGFCAQMSLYSLPLLFPD